MAIQHGLIKLHRVDFRTWIMNSDVKRLFNQYANEPNSDYIILDYEQLNSICNRLSKTIAHKDRSYISDIIKPDNLKTEQYWNDLHEIHRELVYMLNNDLDPKFDLFIYWVA